MYIKIKNQIIIQLLLQLSSTLSRKIGRHTLLSASNFIYENPISVKHWKRLNLSSINRTKDL